MLIVYLAVAVIGVAAGILTGITPGLHPNTILFSSLPFYFGSGVETAIYISFVSSLAISHTFHDFLPALFLAPMDSETALASLPGSGLVEEGEGLKAFRATVRGGLYGLLLVLIMTPLLLNFLEGLYTILESVMFEIVLFFLLFSVVHSDSIARGVIIAFLAGSLGVLAFDTAINQNYVLTSIFTGLFTFPALLNISRPSDQQVSEPETGRTVSGGIIGALAGMMSGIVPGVGAATSTTLLSPLMNSEEEFMAGMGAVNTTDIFVSLFTLFLVGKARNGPAVIFQAIGGVKPPLIVFSAGIVLFSAAISIPVAIRFSSIYVDRVMSIDVWLIKVIILPSLFLINFYLSGFQGLLVFLTAGIIGYAAFISDQRRASMAVLMVPVLLNYSGGII